MTQRERGVAAEIRRIAREDLGLAWEGSDDEDLTSRLDSLARLSLVVALEDRYRVRIGEEEGTSARSLADLARIVAGKLEPAEAGT